LRGAPVRTWVSAVSILKKVPGARRVFADNIEFYLLDQLGEFRLCFVENLSGFLGFPFTDFRK
jgi:hypothetical protein